MNIYDLTAPMACNIKTRGELFVAMVERHRCLVGNKGYHYISSIEMEDGSGLCFNVGVTKISTGKRETVFCRVAKSR